MTAVRYLEEALRSMEVINGVGVFGPQDFLSYCNKHEIPIPKKTPSVLSLDTLSEVPRYLRDQNTMVFRMGGGEKLTNTRFVLAQTPDGPACFFFDDAKIFPEGLGWAEMDPMVDPRFLGYKLAPKLQEMALVNLGFACGALGKALGLDRHVVSAPAMLSSRYTFNVKIHPKIPDVFEHRSGQVQIDGLFTAERAGKLELFVVEAKFVKQNKSLAKHKLVYPTLSMEQDPRVGLPVVPVYLSVLEEPDQYVYRLAECGWPEGVDKKTISNLEVENVEQIRVRKRG